MNNGCRCYKFREYQSTEIYSAEINLPVGNKLNIISHFIT